MDDDALDDSATQDVRVAVLLNGGVSLAVWMSGVTLELHDAALASRGLGERGTYHDVLTLLHATLRVDVIAGTSAGGINVGDIGRQTVTQDAAAGSDTFARTVSHAATVVASTVGTSSRLTGLRPVRAVLRSLRGYTLLVWVMVSSLSSGSRFGARSVTLAMAVGGALLAVSLVVAQVPPAITAIGVLLVLAGLTVATLRAPGAGTLARRLAVLAVGVAVVLGISTWLSYRRDPATVLGPLVSFAVVVGVTLLGLYLGSGGTRSDRSDDDSG